MQKKMPSVVHLVTPYLFHTGPWIYSQVIGLKRFRSIVFTQRKENLDQFPFIEVYSPEDFSLIKKFFNRVYRKAFDRYGMFFDKFCETLKPQLFQAHFGFEAARWLNFLEKTGVPLVTTFYGQDVSKLGRVPKWQKRYARLFDYGVAVLAEGTHLKSQLINIGCPERKIFVQHLGVELNKYPQKPNEGKERRERTIILQVSSFREKKGIEYSLEAISRVRERIPAIEYRLIGWGDDDKSSQAVLSLIRKLRLSDCVKLLGIMRHDAMIEEMLAADIFLHPSITALDGDNEGGAPVCVIEASAMGLPIVSTIHADIPEVVIDQKSGFLAPERDSAALAEHIVNLVENPQLRAEFGRAGRRHISQEYDLGVQLEKLEEIYFDLLGMATTK
jgi:colanic acid/amylovoran biosynthesis glycosyltransferase